MRSEAKREHEFKEAASRILKKWEEDRLNLSNVTRSMFGRDATKLASNFVSSVANKTAAGLVTGTLTEAGKATLATTLTGRAQNVDWVGALNAGGVFGAAAGLIVGAITHVGLTYHDQAKRKKNSPYRFLTTLENTGLLCRF